MAVLPTVLSVIYSVTPSIEVTDAIYEVNNQGDLTIQITGNYTGISIETSQFRLEIPEDFEVTTLTNGSPVMKMISNGSAIEITEESNKFNCKFALRTYNTTVLPRNYFLEMNSSTLQYSEYVTPQWPEQDDNIGSGASIAAWEWNPYITGLSAYNSYKGNNEHVKTYIYNPSYSYPRKVTALQYKIFAGDYDDWEDWTPVYSENTWIGERETLVVHDYLNYMFTATSNKIYALNAGDNYKITKVEASGTDYWGSWDSTFNPSSPGEFDVTIQLGTHPVFVVCVSNAAWYNYGYSDPATKITEASQHFADDYDVILHPIPYPYWLEWNASYGESTYDLLYRLRGKVGDLLGLDTNWINIEGTSIFNHGFDVAAGFTGYMSDYAGDAGKNHLVVTGGSIIRLLNEEMENLFQHELSHCYGAIDRYDYQWWYGQPSVMSSPVGLLLSNDWGWIDYLIMNPSRGQFDGA